MNPSDVVFSLLILAVIGFQVWLTRRVWQSRVFDRSQKLLQSKVIWLLPVLGAALVFALMPEEDDRRTPPSASA
ncbi:MAG: hypothetical protein KF718_17580 [Polyangiaceae bacterium]|nr:hypothetical protein [Polyangiaceae bacterium]